MKWAIFLQTLYLLLPAYFANMAPVIADKLNILPSLARPVDNGKKIYNEYIFGAGKTWRGLIVGVITAIIVATIQYAAWLQNWQHNPLTTYMPADMSWMTLLFFGFMGGIGALGGDLTKSFVKRRLHIASGKSWPIFDQVDFVLGYIICTSVYIHWTMPVILIALGMTLILHPLTNLISYALKIKKVWW